MSNVRTTCGMWSNYLATLISINYIQAQKKKKREDLPSCALNLEILLQNLCLDHEIFRMFLFAVAVVSVLIRSTLPDVSL